MRLAVCVAVVLILTFSFGLCESDMQSIIEALPLEDMQRLGESAGIDIKQSMLRIATGESEAGFSELIEALKAGFKQSISHALTGLYAVLLPVILCSMLKNVSDMGQITKAAEFICVLTCCAALSGAFISLIKEAETLLSAIAEFTDAAFPIMTTLLISTGATASAAMLTPLSAFLGKLITDVLSGFGISLTKIACAIAVAGMLSPRITLSKLFSFMQSVVNWGAGLCTSVFMGIISVRGMVSAGFDSTSVRTARYAVGSLLPVIGGDVADTMDALISSVLIMKNAAGVTGMLLLLLICAKPMLALMSTLVSMKLAAALSEPLAEGAIPELADRFSKVISMLLVICALGIVMLLLMLGAVLKLGTNVVR